MTESAEKKARPAELEQFLESFPDTTFVEAFIVDVNGIPRGKRLPVSALPRLYDKGLMLPASTTALDIWGRDVVATGLVFETGDADRPCQPVADGLRPLPWSRRPAAQVILGMSQPGGRPFYGDPRHVLTSVAERFEPLGFTPVVATELEFRLFAPEPASDGSPRPPDDVMTLGARSQLYGLDELDGMEALFSDLEEACIAERLPIDTIVAEQGDAQYEVNLRHVTSPVLAADQTLLLKRTIKGVARRHGVLASFMAKPFGDGAGSGMHVHVSLDDKAGRNVFAGRDAGRGLLEHAIGGLTRNMVESTAVFAPHANSFRRFQTHSHVPTGPTWGRDNRTTAVRVPLSRAQATRIEHRVAGADANPYLVVAAVLAGIHDGISRRLDPPPETRGDAYDQWPMMLPDDWGRALDAFEASAFIAAYLGDDYRRLFAACKRQERERFRRDVPRFEYETYLGLV